MEFNKTTLVWITKQLGLINWKFSNPLLVMMFIYLRMCWRLSAKDYLRQRANVKLIFIIWFKRVTMWLLTDALFIFKESWKIFETFSNVLKLHLRPSLKHTNKLTMLLFRFLGINWRNLTLWYENVLAVVFKSVNINYFHFIPLKTTFKKVSWS